MSNSRDPRERAAARGHSTPRTKSKSIYRVRRIIALVVVAVVVALVWLGVSSAISFVQGIFGGGTPNPAVSGSAKVAPGGACDPDSIKLVALVTDASGNSQSSFDSGINPFFSYSITNNSGGDCKFNLGNKVTYYNVTSGNETIYTSGDCTGRESLTDAEITIKAGETLKAPVGEWYRVHSSATGCGAEQNPVTSNGASYHLSVEVAGLKSPDTTQFVLK